MKSGKTTIPGAPRVASALFAAMFLFGASPAQAQTTTWQTYRCADGSEFIVGFFGYDKRAHMQVDGKAVTLEKRIALGGSRYSGGGVTLRVTKSGTTFKIGKRPVTACQLT
jgi:membrane-bound inhibitor of C-type lysozyme